jgi:cytochrome P450
MESEMNAAVPLMPDLDFSIDEMVNLHDVLDELRTHGPVVPVKFMGEPIWLVLGLPETNQAFQDEVNFRASDGYMELVAPTMGRSLNTMHGDELRTHRAALTPSFLPAKVREYIEALIEPVVHELMDEIEGKADVEFVEAFCRLYPFRVITRLLGIPVSDEALLLKWAIGIISFPWDPEGALKTKQEFDAYMLNVLEERRRNPGDNFISMLIAAQNEGKIGTDEEILAFLRLLFPAGADTTYKMAGSLFAGVLSDPKMIALAKQGDKDRQALVSEGLRWQPPAAFMLRKASADSRLGGVDIRKGEWALLGVTAANSDPAVFSDPRQFDPGRDTREMATFGRGVHFCLGVHLARRELETALRVVFTRFPDMRLKPGSTVEFINAGLQRGPRELWVQPLGGD